MNLKPVTPETRFALRAAHLQSLLQGESVRAIHMQTFDLILVSKKLL